MDEREIVVRLRAIEAAHVGPVPAGEDAAKRMRAILAEHRAREPDIETKVSITDAASQHAFVALCLRYGLEPYRLWRSRGSTVCVRKSRTFFQQTFWPLYEALAQPLGEYVAGLVDRILSDAMGVDLSAGAGPDGPGVRGAP